jgi:hypothetical protein
VYGPFAVFWVCFVSAWRRGVLACVLACVLYCGLRVSFTFLAPAGGFSPGLKPRAKGPGGFSPGLKPRAQAPGGFSPGLKPRAQALPPGFRV